MMGNVPTKWMGWPIYLSEFDDGEFICYCRGTYDNIIKDPELASKLHPGEHKRFLHIDEAIHHIREHMNIDEGGTSGYDDMAGLIDDLKDYRKEWLKNAKRRGGVGR